MNLLDQRILGIAILALLGVLVTIKQVATGSILDRPKGNLLVQVVNIFNLFSLLVVNIYPAEIESVLHAHPMVAEAALIGVPDPKWGEVGRAMVVLKPGAKLTADELLAFCQTRLAKFKIPKSVIFVDGLPKTAATKVDKKLLAEQYGQP